MGRIAILIAVSYGILGGLAVVAIGAVVSSSTLGRQREIDARRLAEREKTWFGIAVVLLVSLLFATIFFTRTGAARDPGGRRSTFARSNSRFSSRARTCG